MKYLFIASLALVCLISCNSTKNIDTTSKNTSFETDNDTIRISNIELEYEVIIYEPGFYAWLETQPPKGYYGVIYLENRNRQFILSYNSRVIRNKNRSLYVQEINYDPKTKYGMEVNYLLYNYFIYFQEKYKQKL